VNRALSSVLIVLLWTLAAASCGDPETAAYEPADREFREFQSIYPVLVRDCGFHACHGGEDRPFRIYGPGRVRLDDEERAFDRVTGDEISLSFSLTLSMVDAGDPAESLLLRKPLAVEAGGVGHHGVDRYGRDVYRTANDEGYLRLARFVFAVTQSEEDDENE
jgi:hypothetical protein